MTTHQRNLVAQNPDGDFVNVLVGHDGRIDTNVEKTAFGELSTSQYTPIIQETFMYNVNTAKWNTGSTNGTLEQKNGMAYLTTQAVGGSRLYIETKKKIKYRAGMGICVRFTAMWNTNEAGGYSSYVGIGDQFLADGFFFARENGEMKIYQFNNSAVITEVKQNAWNVDKADGLSYLPAIDFSKGNVFQIKYQYLGFGQISFYIENPKTGSFQLVHAIRYANSNVAPSLNNTTLPFLASMAVGANPQIQSLRVASVGCFVEGTEIIRGIPFIYELSKNSTNVVSHAFTMRNNANIIGGAVANNSIVYPRRLNILNTDTKSSVIIKVIKNATLTGAVYAEHNTNTSMVSFDTTATVAGGNVIAVEFVNASDAHSLDFNNYDLDDMLPGDRLTITAQCVLNQTISIQYALSWLEDP